MKIDPKLTAEFGMPLPPPSYLSAATIGEWIVGHLVPFTVNGALLASGALIGRFYPPAFYWFLGTALFSGLCIVAMFAVVLVANAVDNPENDGDYPGS